MNYDFLVVGSSGLIGSAAVKYLSASQSKVAGVGSPEPTDFSQHDDVFASHYDDARVTRIVDANPVWARLAAESIKRYAAIQRQSGIAFHQPVGCLRIGDAKLIARLAEVGRAFGAEFEMLDTVALKTGFGFVESAGGDWLGLIEHGLAGTISPRHLVRAQQAIARQHGAHLYDDVVVGIDPAAHGCTVRLKSGNRLTAGAVLVAAGAFSNFHQLLPIRLPFKAMPETVVMLPVSERLSAQNIPAMLYYRCFNLVAPYLYATPPMRYSDGIYMKFGAANDGAVARTLEDAVAYFRVGGNREIAAQLAEAAHMAIPEAQVHGYKIKPCILANTDTGLPYISAVMPQRLFVAAGGCGAAAKSSDEIGRLAAQLTLGEDNDACAEFRL